MLLGELCRALASSLCQLAGYGSALALLTGVAAGLSVPWAFSMPVAMGVLHYTKPSCGVSPACRTPV